MCPPWLLDCLCLEGHVEGDVDHCLAVCLSVQHVACLIQTLGSVFLGFPLLACFEPSYMCAAASAAVFVGNAEHNCMVWECTTNIVGLRATHVCIVCMLAAGKRLAGSRQGAHAIPSVMFAGRQHLKPCNCSGQDAPTIAWCAIAPSPCATLLAEGTIHTGCTAAFRCWSKVV